MGTFKEFIIKEAKNTGVASGGKSPSFIRGSQPYAPYNQTPPLSSGRSASQYYQDLEQWKQNVYSHVLSLIEAGNDIEINGKKYLKETDFARYHQAALNLLYSEGIFVKGGDQLEPIIGVNIDSLSSIRYEESQIPGSSGLSQPELMFIDWLWEEYQNRNLINKSADHNWSRHTNFIQKSLLQYTFQKMGIANSENLYLKEILMHEDVLHLYQVNSDKLYSVINMQYYKGVASGLASQAINAAFQTTLKVPGASMQTVR